MKQFITISLGIALLAAASKGQTLDPEVIWELGLTPYGAPCSKTGVNIPGLPEIDDPWFMLPGTCKTYQGSVNCQEEVINGVIKHKCGCNQREDQRFSQDTFQCVGKAGSGAICTAEKTSLIPQKSCTENAHCVPQREGEGRSLGRCVCLDGFNQSEDGKCVPGTGETGTPRTTTTTEAPEAGELQLPLELLLNMRITSYDQACQSAALLNRTYCDTCGGTVACLDKKCQCNMEEDSIFDDELHTCVGLAGSYCLARRNLMGWKACTGGAECYVEEGTTVDEYSFGTCQCMYGYRLEEDRTCTKDSSIAAPSTRRPGGFPTPSTEPPVITEPPPRTGASAMESQKLVVFLMTSLCILLLTCSR